MSSTTHYLPRLLPLAACFGAMFGLTHTHSASAATLLVTDCTDGAGSGTLRHTLAAATSGSTVQIPMSCSTITLTQGHLFVPTTVANLYITGPGSSLLTINGGDGLPTPVNDSVFIVQNTGTLGLTGMTITGAKYKGSNPTGGCIFSGQPNATVSLNDTIVTGCFLEPPAATAVTSKGGAIYTAGSVILVNSTVSTNFALAGTSETSYGGGIYAKKGIIAKYSTISQNFADSGTSGPNSRGGGIFAGGGGDVTIITSTISNNRAATNSALQMKNPGTGSFDLTLRSSTVAENTSSFIQAIGSYWPVTVTNSTIAFNSAAQSGSLSPAGLYSNQTITMNNSIFANNTSDTGTDNDVFSRAATNPLMGANDLIVATTNTGVPLGTLSACPKTGHLADNGGLTQTIALLKNSPALDVGAANGATLDQRGTGFARTVGAGTDIGAYERQAGVTDDEIFFGQFESRCD